MDIFWRVFCFWILSILYDVCNIFMDFRRRRYIRAAIAIKTLLEEIALAVFTKLKLRQLWDWAIGTNHLHEHYMADPERRPSDLYDEEELAQDVAPVPVATIKGAKKGGVVMAGLKGEVLRATQFQLHWAALVRAEFVGYWGTRAEQLCAARWLKIQLSEVGVRKSHIASAIPMILVLAKVPTVDEEAAADLEQSDLFVGATEGFSWPRRLWRRVLGRRTISRRRTAYTIK
jgi:hypothetical protein